MANKDKPNGFKVAYTLTDAPAAKEEFLVDESQTIARGDVVLSVNGYVQIGSAASMNLLGIAAESVTSKSGDKTKKINVFTGVPTTVFEGQCSGTPDQTIISSTVDIEGTTGIMEVDEDASVIDHLKVLSFHPDDEAGANRRVRFIINPAISQVMGAGIGAKYYGDPSKNGSYKREQDGDDLVDYRKEGGVWVEKGRLTP